MDYSSMTREELELLLLRLQNDLEDLEETISFNLTHSSAHISGGQVKKDEESLAEIRDRIVHIQQLLEETETLANDITAEVQTEVLKHENEEGLSTCPNRNLPH